MLWDLYLSDSEQCNDPVTKQLVNKSGVQKQRVRIFQNLEASDKQGASPGSGLIGMATLNCTMCCNIHDVRSSMMRK